MDILNLQSLKQTNVQENDDAIIISATEAPSSISCTHCGGLHYQKFGIKEYLFKDRPIDDKQVQILLKRQRYRCKDCNSTFFAYISDLNSKRNCTNRLIEYIKQQSLSQTHVHIARSVGIDEKTVRNILRDYSEKINVKK